MKALTIKQPWAWAIVHGSKRVENRGWKPSPKLVGQRFAVHAAKVDDCDIAFAKFYEIQRSQVFAPLMFERSAIIGTARIVDVISEAAIEVANFFGPPKFWPSNFDPKWFSGPVGFIIDDVVACDPFPCQGALGFWEAPSGFVDPWGGV